MEYPQWILDATLVPFGVFLLILYNVSFYFRVKHSPLCTVVGVNHVNRRAWVRSIMKDIEKKNILAVQTLRNSIMASTLLASTAMILSAAIAAFVSSSTTSTTISSSINSVVIGAQEPALVTLKFFTILLCFIFSFMCHVQSIRYTNHVNFLIAIPVGPDVPGLTPDYVSSVLSRGSNFYTIGTRGFYCAFPFLLWLFGPIPMLVSCLVLVPTLYYLDTVSGFDSDLSTVHSDDAPSARTSGSESAFLGNGSRMSEHHDVEQALTSNPELLSESSRLSQHQEKEK